MTSEGDSLDKPATGLLTESTLTMVAVGWKVGSYKIEVPLGRGGMGEVFRALDTKLNRPVAIKFLSDRIADPAARRRFQREAQMASATIPTF
jgi:serine/threonine protein kinase